MIYTGTSGWTYDEWAGDYYPQRLGKAKWLNYYFEKLSFVEVNATFYRRFRESTFENWRNKIPEGGKMALKVPRYITHIKYLQDCGAECREFAEKAGLLGEKLAGCLLQMHPKMPFYTDRLKQVIDDFGIGSKLIIEIRNPDWYREETLNILESTNTSYANIDHPAQRLTDIRTSDINYYRLHGFEEWYKSPYPGDFLEKMASALKENSKENDCFIAFNNCMGGHAHRNARQLFKIAGKSGK